MKFSRIEMEHFGLQALEPWQALQRYSVTALQRCSPATIPLLPRLCFRGSAPASSIFKVGFLQQTPPALSASTDCSNNACPCILSRFFLGQHAVDPKSPSKAAKSFN